MLFGVVTVPRGTFIWLKDLLWQCGVQGGGGGGEGWGRGGEGISYVVICCCGREMYCRALRLAPRISYIMSVQRCIFLLTGAMLPEMTYRKRTTQCFQCRKYHIIG